MTTSDAALTQTILALEERLDRAMQRSDVAALGQLLADDLIFSSHQGHVLTKQDDLAMHASRTLVFDEVQASKREVRVMSEGAVVSMQLDLSGRHGGVAFIASFRFTRVWALRDGQWQVIAAHSSQIGG